MATQINPLHGQEPIQNKQQPSIKKDIANLKLDDSLPNLKDLKKMETQKVKELGQSLVHRLNSLKGKSAHELSALIQKPTITPNQLQAAVQLIQTAPDLKQLTRPEKELIIHNLQDHTQFSAKELSETLSKTVITKTITDKSSFTKALQTLETLYLAVCEKAGLPKETALGNSFNSVSAKISDSSLKEALTLIKNKMTEVVKHMASKQPEILAFQAKLSAPKAGSGGQLLKANLDLVPAHLKDISSGRKYIDQDAQQGTKVDARPVEKLKTAATFSKDVYKLVGYQSSDLKILKQAVEDYNAVNPKEFQKELEYKALIDLQKALNLFMFKSEGKERTQAVQGVQKELSQKIEAIPLDYRADLTTGLSDSIGEMIQGKSGKEVFETVPKLFSLASKNATAEAINLTSQSLSSELYESSQAEFTKQTAITLYQSSPAFRSMTQSIFKNQNPTETLKSLTDEDLDLLKDKLGPTLPQFVLKSALATHPTLSRIMVIEETYKQQLNLAFIKKENEVEWAKTNATSTVDKLKEERAQLDPNKPTALSVERLINEQVVNWLDSLQNLPLSESQQKIKAWVNQQNLPKAVQDVLSNTLTQQIISNKSKEVLFKDIKQSTSLPKSVALDHPELSKQFVAFCKKEFSEENVTFYQTAKPVLDRPALSLEDGTKLYESFIGKEAPIQINLPSDIVNSIEKAIAQKNTVDLQFHLRAAHDNIRRLMENDTLKRFFDQNKLL